MTTKIKFAFVMMCLILSYGFCAFAEDDQLNSNRSPASVVEASIDLSSVAELMPENEDSAYQDFEPDYVFSDSEEALLEKDIGNY